MERLCSSRKDWETHWLMHRATSKVSGPGYFSCSVQFPSWRLVVSWFFVVLEPKAHYWLGLHNSRAECWFPSWIAQFTKASLEWDGTKWRYRLMGQKIKHVRNTSHKEKDKTQSKHKYLVQCEISCFDLGGRLQNEVKEIFGGWL